MSQKHPLTAQDIALGEELRWDIFDVHDNLLMRKGFVVTSARQLEALLERGLFADAEEYARSKAEETAGGAKEAAGKPSALRAIAQAQQKLTQLYAETAEQPTECGLPDHIGDIALLVREAIEINPDLTLASMLFKQKSEGYAIRHCIDSAIIAVMLCKSLEKPEQELTSTTHAALTMNIGMLALQEELQNREGALTEVEKAHIRRHPERSAEMLRQAGVTDAEWLACVLHHHENIDGSGYPYGKAGDDIPQNARLISLVDRYTSMLSPRRYRKSVLPNDALRDMLLDRGKGVDPLLAAHFVRTMGVYPPGTFVKLRSGETAVVSHRGKNSATPIAHALIGPFGAPLPFPHKRETSHERYEIREAVHVSEIDIPFNMQQIWGTTGSD